jgi:hypothetical protein
LRGHLPHLLKHGVVTETEVDIETLGERLEREKRDNRAVIVEGTSIDAWARKPENPDRSARQANRPSRDPVLLRPPRGRRARITRILRGDKRKEILRDTVHNRSQFAAFVTVLLAGMVLVVASILVPPPEQKGGTATDGAALQQELAQVRAELAALRELVANSRSDAPAIPTCQGPR